MNGFGDLLLQAAVEWRGRPATFEPGALGTVGDTFNEAFAGAAFSGTEHGRSLAFEYFVGLMFNADYENLADLVESWLTYGGREADLVLELATVPYQKEYNVPNRVLLWRPIGTTYGSRGFAPPEDAVHFPRMTFTLYLYHYPYGLILAWWPGFEIPGYGRWTWWWRRDKGKLGTWEPVPSRFHPTWPDPIEVVPPETYPYIFKPEIVDAVNVYGVGETVEARPYPDPTATAKADNGYIFKSWAEGKFGPTVAQEVGS